jgi:hypothetical protein
MSHTLDQLGVYYFLPVVVFEETAYIGQEERFVYACEDVSNLRLVPEAQGVRLRWDWPEQCVAVAIVRRHDDWPTGMDDSLATRFHYSRTEYERNFNSFFDKITGTHELFYIVYGQPDYVSDRVYSPGLSGGCRAQVQVGGFGQLSYSLTLKRQAIWFGPYNLLLKWKFDVRPGRFSGFHLVGNPHTVPSKSIEGIELFRWTPEKPEELPAESQEMRIQLDETRLRRLGRRFYCRMFHLNLDEQEQILIIHPDLNHPFIVS